MKLPLKCGHLTNQDNLGSPKGSAIEKFHCSEVPCYIRISGVVLKIIN